MFFVLVVGNAGGVFFYGMGGCITHPTEYHQCAECPTVKGRKCIHTKYKCANCTAAGHADTQHAAYNTRCPVKVHAVREAWQKTRLEAVSLEHILAETNPITNTTMTADE
jgi:hypothetical protein